AVAVRALSEKGFCISTGSACSARKNERPVLHAMGITNEQAIEAVRFSFGHAVSDEDIDALVHALKDMSAAFSSHSFSNALFR
ncbi:MAG: aminotransferase class V-fold PLP-dependent enzyme, partial [Treponema lecithinolyticum]